MTSSVHTLLDCDKVAFQVSLFVIVMNEHALIKAIVIFPYNRKIRFSYCSIANFKRERSRYRRSFETI